VLAALLVGSACCSGAETALFKLSAGQLYRLKTSSNRFSRLAASLMAAPSRVLNALLLGNLIVNTAFEAIAAVTIIDLDRRGALSNWLAGAASLAPLLAVIVFGEVLPKALAFNAGPGAARLAALPVSLLAKALRPPIWLLDALLVKPLTRILSPRTRGGDITPDELAALLELSAKRGIIGHDASLMMQEVVELTDLRAGDIMVPRVDMIAFDVNEPAEKLVETFRTTRLRRIPVYEGNLDKIFGVVQAKRLLLSPGAPVRELIVPAVFVPQAANLEKVLLQFRVTRTQMAVVVDEFGGTAGLVTLEDVLEEIVGEIPDEHSAQRVAAVERTGDRRYVLDGELAIHEWADAFKMDLSGRRISTVGGFVTSLLGRIPRPGDAATYRNLRFTVQSMRGRRIEKLKLELLEASE